MVLASGYNREPVLPSWPGQEAFPGTVLHASRYTSPAPFRGKNVLVVGAGNTGAEIAADLAEAGAASVRLAVRTPPNVIPRTVGPIPNTLLGISLPTMLMTPFAVFFLRQFFLGISREVEEAALVEGASKVRVFFRLILPMSSAPLATLGILTYITSWNDYFWPLMVSYTDRSRVLTVALGVFKSQTPQTGPDWSGLMAATLVAALPMLVLFCFFAKRIVNSIGFSGIK